MSIIICFQCVFCVGHDGQIKIKDEDKEEKNLDLGDYNDQEKDNDYYYPDKEGKKGDSKEKEEDKGLKIEDENCELKTAIDCANICILHAVKVKASKAVNFSKLQVHQYYLEITSTGIEYGDGEDIVEGDIKMTLEQAALFKRGGWDELVKSLAWKPNHGKWSRTIPYTITGVG